MAITYINAAYSASDSVSLPSGYQNGDVALVVAKATTTTPSVPSGWGNLTPGGVQLGSGQYAVVGYKVLTSSDTSTGTWTSAQFIIAAIYRGADTAYPIDLFASWSSGGTSQTTISCPALTPTKTTSIVVGIGNGATTSTQVEDFAPSGMTNRTGSSFNSIMLGIADAAAGSYAGGDWVSPVAGVKGAVSIGLREPTTYPIVADQDTKSGVQTSNSSSWTLTYPTNIAAGDLLLALVATDGNTSVPTWPEGWVGRANAYNNAITGHVAKKKATGSETGTFTFAPGASEQGSWTVLRIPAGTWYGVLGTDFLNGSGSGSVEQDAVGTTDINPDPPSINPFSWDAETALWFAVTSVDTSRTVSAYPSSPDTFTNTGYLASGGAGGATLAWARLEKNASSVDPGTFTISNSDDWSASTIAIRPRQYFSRNAQAQTEITGGATQVQKWAQTQTHIKAFNVEGFAQSQTDIKQIYRAYAQSHVDIKQAYSVWAQAQTNIKIVSPRWAQAQSSIKTTYNLVAQSQADIKSTYNAFAQTQADILAIIQSFAQANASIIVVNNAVSQVQAQIKSTYNTYGQSQALLKTTYLEYAQAHTQIRQIYNIFAQAQVLILVIVNNFAQIQAKIKSQNAVFSQAQASIKQVYNTWAQAQTQISAGAVTTDAYAQAQTNIIQTYQTWAQAQTDINQTYTFYSQAQSQINQTYQSYAQAGAKISTTRTYAQAQGWIEQLSNNWAQTIAYIKVVDIEAFAQSKTQIKQTYHNWAQGNAWIEITTNKWSQANVQIKQIYQAWAQAGAKVATTRVHAQGAAWIEQTYNGWSQANAYIKSTEIEAFAQAQASIISVYQSYAQAEAQIVGTIIQNVHAQAEAWIEVTTNQSAQASVWIKSTYRGYAQASVWIKQTYPRGSGDVTIALDTFTESGAGTVLLQSHTADIGGSWTKQLSLSPDIEVDATNDWAIAVNPGTETDTWKDTVYYITNVSLADGYIDINLHAGETSNSTGSQAFIRGTTANQTSYAVIYYNHTNSVTLACIGTTGSTTSLGNINSAPGGWVRLQATGNSPTSLKVESRAAQNQLGTGWQLETSDNTSANQRASGTVGIKLSVYDVPGGERSDPVDDLKAVQTGGGVDGPTFAQVQSSIKSTYQTYAQVQARIKATYKQFAQSQAAIKRTYYVWAQSGTVIKQTYQGYAQSEARIIQTYQSYAQVQAKIATTRVHAQAEASILATNSEFAQANAYIAGQTSWSAQAQATIAATSAQFAQAEAWIEITTSQFAQAQGWIENTYNAYAQAQAHIEATYNIFAQASAWIENTYSGFAQAQTYILLSGLNAYGQAQALILQTYQGFAQVNAYVIVRDIEVYAQAAATIKATYNVWTQAQAYIKVTDNEAQAQAQALIKQTYSVFAQSEAYIKTTDIGVYAQAGAEIKTTYNVHAQAEAYISTTNVVSAQAQAQIYIPQHVHPVADISNDGWRGVVI